MDWLQRTAEQTPDAPALAVGGRTLSYAEFHSAADAVAAALLGSGIDPGARVVLPGEGTLPSAAGVWGIPRGGAAAVALSRTLPPVAAMELTRAIGVKAVWSPTEAGWAARAGRHRHDEWGPPHPNSGYVVFTSGTGGRPKGVVLTGANIAASAAASQERLGNSAEDRWLCALPLHHVGALSIFWRSAREGGAVVLHDGFDAAKCAAALRSGEVTMASLVPTMLRRILDVDAGPYTGVRAVLVGGGPAPTDLLARARAAGLPVLETYGTTETASQIATQAPGDEPGAGALPLNGVEVRVVDLDDRPLAPGEVGRILVRGAVVSPGYAGEPGRLPGSWLATGDLGSLDREGRLTVAGRADNVVVTGGENVAPAAVEAVLGSIDGVLDVKVSGEPDPEWGSAVVAEVVLAEGAVLDAIRTAAAGHLARHELPKRWIVVERIEHGWKSDDQP